MSSRVALLAAALLLAPPTTPFSSHPDAALEWWYWTGHLADSRGRAYGFQVTFFRLQDFHLAHFAWSDVSGRKFTFDEKAHLGLPGIAGASEERLDVFNEDWSAVEKPGGLVELRTRGEPGALRLTLKPAKPLVTHGADGISRKGAGPDDFSHYVSQTRLIASGALSRGGKSEPLTGTAWFDHEWGPGGLPAGVAGWDWFALQLSDGSELMLYRMRLGSGGGDGSASPFSAGTFVDPSGRATPVRWSDVTISPRSFWTSPRSGARYPAVWSVAVRSAGLEATVTPLLADQELVTTKSTGVTYWEGACAVDGRREGKPIGGRAYVEMTGYAGRDVPGLAK